MEKKIMMLLVALAGFIAGATWNDWFFGNLESRRDNHFKMEVIRAQDNALMKAQEVMNNNNLYDTDGGDAMADYMSARTTVDSLYRVKP